MLIAECAEDGFYVLLPDYPGREKIAHVGDVDVEAAFPTTGYGAKFWIVRDRKEMFSFIAPDLSSSVVWIAVDHSLEVVGSSRNPARIALTYSDGGSIGRFHLRVFLIEGDKVRDDSKSVEAAVADFSTRHFCKPRGNNVTALKWIQGNLLLMTEVYPTGDCGPDLGHTEGYVVTVPEGKILEHLTLSQLKRKPGVCLENGN